MKDALAQISARYSKFAEDEAHGKSPLYEELAGRIAADPAILAYLSELPREKQQPNLLFAAAKYLHGTPRGWETFRTLILQRGDQIAGIMKARRTQTNVPERCATLLPLLARLPQPLALLEVGASAGLCVLPDYYAYLYGPICAAGTARRGTAADPRLPSEPGDAAPCPWDRGRLASGAGFGPDRHLRR